MSLLNTAKRLLKNGISVIATGPDKRALFSWTKFQKSLPATSDVEYQFSDPRCKGLAIICGAVSGNYEVLDIDTKHDLTGTLYERLCSDILEALPNIFDKLLVTETRTGGKHFSYTCKKIGRNKELARRPATDEEKKENPNEKILVLIETRGEGGYAIAPPTEGYRVISGDKVHEITPEEREVLFEICRSFNEWVEEEKVPYVSRSTTEVYAVTPWEDYNNRGVNDMLQRLQNHGWSVVKEKGERIIFKRPGKTDSKSSGDFHHGLNLFKVFTTSSVFDEGKGYKPSAVFTKLEAGGDFKKAAVMLSELGYGEKPVMYESKFEREVYQKKRDGYSREDLVKFINSRDKKVDPEEALTNLEKKWGDQLLVFWDVEIDKDNRRKININRTRFISFLHNTGGFGLYFYDKNSTIYRIVRMVDGFVEEASTEQMKKFILEYIDALPDTFDGGITPDLLKELVMKQYNSLFNEAFLEFCERVEPDFLKDELGTSYFPFRNGVVVVSKGEKGAKGKIELVSYGSIQKYIWKSQVIDFSVSIDQDFDMQYCEFFRFIEKISGDEEDRWLYALTLIGYLLHKYKDPSTPYSVILAEETESEAEGGGTGKGILVKAISYLINTERVDGKNFKLDKNFAFQRVNLDTKLISIEDVRKNVDFEGFFSIITEGITVEKKNKDELYIPFKDSPKILFTTNYTISSNTKAAQRRQKVFEFSPFFGPTNTPRDFFGHNLFDEWDKDEWNRFYNLMFAAVDLFFSAGIKEVQNSEKLKRKSVRLTYGEEGLEYWDNYSANGCSKWKPVKEMYHSFLNEYDIDKKHFALKKFRKMIESCCNLFDAKLEDQRNWQAGGQVEYRVLINGKSCDDTEEYDVTSGKTREE